MNAAVINRDAPHFGETGIVLHDGEDQIVVQFGCTLPEVFHPQELMLLDDWAKR